MCRNLEVSKSGFYGWLGRSKSQMLKDKVKLMVNISELFYIKHKQMAGSPLITHDLNDIPEYKTLYRSRVAALMKEMGLKCKIQKKIHSNN
jgi:putative transposase